MKVKEIYMGKIEKDKGLLEFFQEFVEKNSIVCGIISGIGALQNLNFMYYKQDIKKYISKSLNFPVEVVNLTGNISLKDEKPFVHAHITVADENGNSFGGHLSDNSKVFAFEYTIIELEGEVKNREYDNITGLFLWK